MRIIKFRSWDKKKKEFWHDFRVSPFGHIEPATSSKNGLWIYDFKYNQKNVVLMQFTGLKDKNGKEIYEGDIIKQVLHYPNRETIDGRNYKVVWKNGYFQISGAVLCGSIAPYHEIIGNIYENSKLLKGGD